MSDQTDLVKLYSGRILALAADIPHLGRLDNPDGTAMARSPVCGSQVTVDVRVKDGNIIDFAQDVKACALGQAAAAIVGQHIIGQTATDVTRAKDQLQDMLAHNGPVPDTPFEGFEVLKAAVGFKNRHGSILLSLKAARDAMVDVANRMRSD